MTDQQQSIRVFSDLVLYKRANSNAWQCRYKHLNKWLRQSTGCEAFENAKEQATTIWHEARWRAKQNLPVQSKRFKDIATEVAQSLQARIDAGKAKAIDKDYVTCINKYLIPYFAKHHVDKIDGELLAGLDDWRQEKMGKLPTRSTIATHNAALNLVFKLAEQRGYLSAGQRPTLSNNGRRGEVRASFSKAEYEVIWRNLRHWVKRGRNDKSKMMRELLRDYVFVLANTGIRHGTEAMNLRWSDIDWLEEDGERYLRLTVRGKVSKIKGARTVIARHGTAAYFKRIQSRFPALNKMTFDELLRARVDDYVFRLADGTRTKSLPATFEAFLQEYDLLHTSTSPLNRTLYSLRHMYTTLAIRDGTNPNQLAKQLGTSVLMIDRHYNKFSSEMNAKHFAGLKRTAPTD